MTATGRWLLNFLIWSVHVSTYVEVDTMVLRIPSDSKVTSPLAYGECIVTNEELASRALK